MDPHIVRKWQRRLDGLDGLVIVLSAKGLTYDESCARLAEVLPGDGVRTDHLLDHRPVIEGMSEWQKRPRDPGGLSRGVHRPINVKIRGDNVVNRPIDVALGVTRDVLGLWAGEHGDGEGSMIRLRGVK